MPSKKTTRKSAKVRTVSVSLDTAIQVGMAYLIRTATVYHLGRVKMVTPSEVVLDECSWVADTGRFGICIATGNLNEVEMMGNGVIVPRCNIMDMTPWKHNLPKESK